jgi:hypothetical protein
VAAKPLQNRGRGTKTLFERHSQPKPSRAWIGAVRHTDNRSFVGLDFVQIKLADVRKFEDGQR